MLLPVKCFFYAYASFLGLKNKPLATGVTGVKSTPEGIYGEFPKKRYFYRIIKNQFMSLKKVFFVLFCLISCSGVFAQLNGNCPGCVANTAQFGSNITDFSVGLFPDSITVTQDDSALVLITYLLPKQVNTGISIAPTATVTEVQILGINAAYPIPSGLNVTCNNYATNCQYYPQTNRYGCVYMCGLTHDAATNGWVQAKITVAGTGSAAGQTQTQNQDISFYYRILPDTNACHTVCFQNKVNTGCDSATIGVLAGIDITCADPILHPCSFAWDYGNGQTGAGLTVQQENYASPGSYPVTLTKRTRKLIITSAALSTVSGWSNICNGYNVLNPGANHYELNFSIGSATYNTSSCCNGPQSYNNLNYPVDNQAVAITVQDNCLLTTLNSSTATLTVNGPGTYTWSVTGSNAASGSITVAEVPQDSVSYTDSVHIYASPVVPVVLASHDSICSGDSVRLSIGAQYAGMTVNWYQDSTYLAGYTDSAIYVYTSGNYRAKVIDPISHCTSISAATPVAVSTTVPNAGNILYSPGQHELYLNPFDPATAVTWYYDSVAVSGQSGRIIPYLGDGTYQAVIYPAGFLQCSFTSPAYVLNTNTGIEDPQNDVYDLSVYPNPNNGTFAVSVNVVTVGDVAIKVTDMLGREVYSKSLSNQTGVVKDNMNLSDLAKNVYTLEVSTAKGKITKRVVIE